MLTARKHKVGIHIEGSMIAEQLRVEQESIQAGVNRYRELAAEAALRGDGPSLKPVERFLLHWYRPLREAIKHHQRNLRKNKYTDSVKGVRIWGPVLLQMDADRLAVITMHEVLSELTQSPEGAPLSQVGYAIGRAVIAELSLDTLKEKQYDAYRAIDYRIKSFNPCNINWYCNRTLTEPIWSRKVCGHVGVRLLQDLRLTASADDYVGREFAIAVRYYVVRDGKKTIGMVRLDDKVLDMIEEGHQIREYLRPRYSMMLIPPLKWTKDDEGGFVRIKTPLVRKLMPGQRAAIAKADMSRVYEGVNALNESSVCIDRDTYALEKQVFEEGGGIINIPPVQDPPWPPHPESSDEAVMKKWKRAWGEVKEQRRYLKGQRREMYLMLDEASRFLHWDKLWQTYDLDFRGRAYPQAPSLNHYGQDRMRALIEFAEARPLTPDGLRSLKIHAAGVYGVDKCNLDDRVRWVDAHMDEIQASARDPLNTTFWQEADGGGHPWQFLQCCRALTDGESAAHIPCEIDGTANAFQHYAALARDLKTARWVNLVPADMPNDPYTDVAEMLSTEVARDAEHSTAEMRVNIDQMKANGWSIDERFSEWRYDPSAPHAYIFVPLRNIAKNALPYVNRKTVKPGSMTWSYDVSIVGARKQVTERLVAQNYPHGDLRQVSIYLSRGILRTIPKVTPASKRVMDWLQAMARLVAQKVVKRTGKRPALKPNQPVTWTTPMGFPVVQHYRNPRKVTIGTCVQNVRLSVDDESLPVLVGKQIDAFAANFIHSLDACHMFAIATAARKEGLSFLPRHDCYGTHANDVRRLKQIANEEFVRLHEQPILLNLHREFSEKYKETEFPPPPEPGEWDVRDVLKSEYAFS